MDVGAKVQNMLSRAMRWSGRHAPAVLVAVGLVTLGAVGVLLTVEPNVETDIQAGYFATHDEQANFFRELRADVAGVNSEIVYFELRPDAEAPDADDPRCMQGAADCPRVPVTDVHSMEALRAQEELFAYVDAEFQRRSSSETASTCSVSYLVEKS